MRRSPRIAVVVPAYNHGPYIEQAIRSILSQDWPELELRILDDGSSDNTIELADATLKDVTGVRWHLDSQSNVGAAVTLNRLVAATDADYVAILNSDDRFLPDRLTTIMQKVTSHPFLAFSGVAFDKHAMANEEISFEEWYRGKLAYALSLPSCGFALLTANLAISSGNFVFSRRLFDDVGGFNAALPLTHDWEFLLKALRWTEPVFVPQRLLYYRVHATNTFRQLTDIRIDQSKAAFAAFLDWADMPAANGLSPKPENWRRFFQIFACSCAPAFSTEPIADFLPGAILEAARDIGKESAHDRLALSNMLKGARGRDEYLKKPTDDLLHDVAGNWASMRDQVRLGR